MKVDGLRVSELRACHGCTKPVAGRVRDGSNAIDFHVVDVERHFVMPGPVERHVGLTMFLGGNGALAQAMGGDEETTKVFTKHRVFVCNVCWMDRFEVLSHRDEPLGEDVGPDLNDFGP